MLTAIESHLVPLGAELPFVSTPAGAGDSAVAGGFFIYVRLPAGASADELSQRAQRDENLVVAAESMCRVPVGEGEYDAGVDRFVRLCFAWEDEEVLLEGVERIGRVLRGMLDEGGAGGRRSVTAVAPGLDGFT
jgi:hypothetical protein